MPIRVLMPEYQQPYGIAALTTLGRLLEYYPTGYGPILQADEREMEQQRKWHPGWDLPYHAPENRIACIDAYLFLYVLTTYSPSKGDC